MVLKVVSTPARVWDRGARYFVERLYVLEQLGDEVQRFFRRRFAGSFEARPVLKMPYKNKSLPLEGGSR